jgi:hypothetical protein
MNLIYVDLILNYKFKANEFILRNKIIHKHSLKKSLISLYFTFIIFNNNAFN